MQFNSKLSVSISCNLCLLIFLSGHSLSYSVFFRVEAVAWDGSGAEAVAWASSVLVGTLHATGLLLAGSFLGALVAAGRTGLLALGSGVLLLTVLYTFRNVRLLRFQGKGYIYLPFPPGPWTLQIARFGMPSRQWCRSSLIVCGSGSYGKKHFVG